MKKICLLGSTGSIGEQTIDIIDKNPNDFSLVAISCGKQVEKLERIINSHPSIKYVCVGTKEAEKELNKLYKDLNIKIYSGDEGLLELIENSSPDLVVNALVGFVGFIPSTYAIEHDIDLALANKESLVVGGEIINDLLTKHKSKLYPIDSEHVALAKCLEGKDRSSVKNLVITASGGSFRDKSRDELVDVSVSDALKHPSWSMGAKITIDSATMMNKGFEIIEAMHLFHFGIDQIKVLLHDESVIHSAVEFKDHSFLADLGPADMRVPISHALYGGKRVEVETRTLDLEELGSLHFRKFDIKRYPCVQFALDAISKGGTLPTVLNRANEEAVYAFLANKIKFLDIESIIKKMMDEVPTKLNPTIEDIVKTDKLTKKLVLEEIERRRI